MASAPPSPPMPPASPSESALYALIARLQAQIAELEAQLNVGPPSAPPPDPISSPPPLGPLPPLGPPPPLRPDGDSFVWWHIALPVGLGGVLVLLVFLGLIWYLCCRGGQRMAGKRIFAPSRIMSVLRRLFGTAGHSSAKATEAPGFGDNPSQSATLHAEMMMDTSQIVNQQSLGILLHSTGGEASGRVLLLQKLFASKGRDGSQRQAEAEALLVSSAEGSEAQSLDVDSLVRSIGSLDAALVFVVSKGGSEAQVSSLLHRGASPRASLLGRGPALAMAARRCSHGVARLLLDANAGVDEKDSRGWTPLMHAIDADAPTNPRESTITLLLDHGAAVDVWSEDLRGPLDLMTGKDSTPAPVKSKEGTAGMTKDKVSRPAPAKSKDPTTPGNTKGKDSKPGHAKSAPPPGADSRRV